MVRPRNANELKDAILVIRYIESKHKNLADWGFLSRSELLNANYKILNRSVASFQYVIGALKSFHVLGKLKSAEYPLNYKKWKQFEKKYGDTDENKP